MLFLSSSNGSFSRLSRGFVSDGTTCAKGRCRSSRASSGMLVLLVCSSIMDVLQQVQEGAVLRQRGGSERRRRKRDGLSWIERVAVEAELVVKVRARGAAGVPALADDGAGV